MRKNIVLLSDDRFQIKGLNQLNEAFGLVKYIENIAMLGFYFKAEDEQEDIHIERRVIDENTIVLYYALPFSKLANVFPSQKDILYAEWKASIDLYLTKQKAHVINSSWVLGNFGLQSSNSYWTHRVNYLNKDEVTTCYEEGETNLSRNNVEVIVTQNRIFSSVPHLIELEFKDVQIFLYKVQNLLKHEELDMLSLSILFKRDMSFKVIEASANLPFSITSYFIEAIDDCSK